MKKIILLAVLLVLAFACEMPNPTIKPDNKENVKPNPDKKENPNQGNSNKNEDKNKDPKINWDNISSADYELSSDGLTLVKWKGRKTRNLDMSKDPELAKVTKIGNRAFESAAALENIFISNKVTIIGNTAFESSSLKSIVMSNSVTTIEYGAFMFSSDLVNIDFSSSLTTIENSAFEYCENIKALVLPKTLTNIGQSVFNACSAVTEITLKMTKVPAYPNGLLEGADALQKIYVPADLVESYKTTAGWSEFAGKFEAIKK